MGAVLVPVDKGRPIAVDKAVIFIGRHPDCDIVLTRSRKVSRKHCCIAQVNDRFVIRDLGSMNGVRVNGKRIQTEAPVQVGDEVAIGDVRYILQMEKVSTRRKRTNGDLDQENRVSKASPEATHKNAQPPANLSQDFPVAIPESSESFQVESSIQQVPESIPLVNDSALPVDGDSSEEEEVIQFDGQAEPDEDDSDIEILPE